MTTMLEVCPSDPEKCTLFSYLFLSHPPRELCMLLVRAAHKDLKTLAEQADELWALHAQEELVGGCATSSSG
jgi:hypothetical protein